MNVIEGLRANYSGKVLARAIRAVKEQDAQDRTWASLLSVFDWYITKEKFEYWNSVDDWKPNPDQWLPKNYVDVSLTNEGNNTETIDSIGESDSEKSPWISVEERLPDHENNVLAVLDGEVCPMAYSTNQEDGEEFRVWCMIYDGLYGDPIYDDNYSPTHWMDIPKPPKTTEK